MVNEGLLLEARNVFANNLSPEIFASSAIDISKKQTKKIPMR